ncbi:hypothetical protein PFISCL1PPCAC_22407, partial [Pristionchus fissidentatus]
QNTLLFGHCSFSNTYVQIMYFAKNFFTIIQQLIIKLARGTATLMFLARDGKTYGSSLGPTLLSHGNDRNIGDGFEKLIYVLSCSRGGFNVGHYCVLSEKRVNRLRHHFPLNI